MSWDGGCRLKIDFSDGCGPVQTSKRSEGPGQELEIRGEEA